MPLRQLDVIQSSHALFPDHSQRCLTFMFEWWLNYCDEPTCEVLIEAVGAIGRRDVAEQLNRKYGEQLHTQ